MSFAKLDRVLSTACGVLGEQMEIKELVARLGKIIEGYRKPLNKSVS